MRIFVTLPLLPVLACPSLAQDPPKVVQLSPLHLACDVDATTTTVITVTFDQPMDTHGFSLCGGGPTFPEVRGRPVWKDDHTLVAEVALLPDHDYQLGLNCPAASNFRSRNGRALPPQPWSFSTLPKQLPDPQQQHRRNQLAFAQLIEVLNEHYSHHDLRVKNWSRLVAEHKPRLLAAPTDKAFAGAAAAMLQPTADIHLYLRCGERVFPTGTRAVDPLFRRDLLGRYVQTEAIGNQALAGRTDDGIGYVLIAAWSKGLDLRGLDQALAGLRDCKAMLIDARTNSGGDEMLAQHVAGWFVEGQKAYAKNRYRVKPGSNGFGPVLERTLSGNADADKRFTGPIAVLTSRYVMSSNESFVMMLQQAKDCTVVGQPTYGSSGNPKPYDLGNGVTLVVPTWQDLRLDGSCIEGEGLQPDVLVECTAEMLQQRDPILERALQLLRQKLGK